MPDCSMENQTAKGTKMTYCFRNVWKSELSKDSVTKKQGDFIWKLSNKLFVWIIFDTLLFISTLMSSAVSEVLSQPWRRLLRRRRAKTLTFSNISVINEDIYLKLRIVVHYQKGNEYQ